MELGQLLDPVMIAKVGLIMVMVNGCLLGVHKIVESIAKFTETKADDKVADILGKVAGGISKIVEVALGSLGKK